MAVIRWLRRSFLAGFFVTVPLVISVFALVWIFGIIDGFTAPLAKRVLGRAGRSPDCVHVAGLLITLLFVLTVGVVATNVIGRRLLTRARGLADDDPGVPDHLCAGEAAGRGVLAGQRDRVQARGDGG